MIVLDTHAFIWFANGSDRLGPKARKVINQEADAGDARVAAISCWEIALLASRKSVDFGRDARDWLTDALAMDGFHLIDLNPEIAFETVRMEWDHRDPADRMIVAAARVHDAPVVTADRAILAYAAAGHVKAIDAGE